MAYKTAKLTSVTFCFCLLASLTGSQAAVAQIEMFETKDVEKRVARVYSLTSKDMTVLKPMIVAESDNILSLYEYYSDQEDVDFAALWNALISRDSVADGIRSSNIAPRQRVALKAARIELECSILEQWIEIYLDTLDDRLELDRLQSKYVGRTFYQEFNERMKMLRSESGDRLIRDPAWEKVRETRERKLRVILSKSQFRTYLQIVGGSEPIARVMGT